MRITPQAFMLAVAGAVLVGAALWALDSQPASGPLPKLRRARETTFLTAPLDDDGNVDYAAALNDYHGRGVEPEQNVLVGLWNAWGPKSIGEPPPAEYFELLGIQPPPAEGTYLTSSSAYVREASGGGIDISEQMHKQIIEAFLNTWTARKYPAAAGWVKSNEAPLRTAAEAVRRKRYFRPIVPDTEKPYGPMMFWNDRHEIGLVRDLTYLWITRANLRLGEENFAAAADDLLACRRLARLVAHGPTRDDANLGFLVDAMTIDPERRMLSTMKPTAAELRRYLEELKTLEPPPHPNETFERADRYQYLDVVRHVRESNSEAFPAPLRPVDAARAARIDFDAVLSSGNRWFDRTAGARRRLRFDPPRGRAQLAELREEFAAILKTFPQGSQDEKPALKDIADADISDYCLATFFPASRFEPYGNYERQEQELDLSKLTVATTLFRLERDRYPTKLEELVPAYLKEIPHDRYFRAPLVYRSDANGAVLYSLGPNGRDDGGVNKADNLDEQEFDEDLDDRTVRIGPAK